MRADQLLVARGLAETRSQAQRLIASGVRWDGGQGWLPVNKNGQELPDDAQLELLDDAEQRYVSRGGLKLEGALKHVGVDAKGAICLDIGQSTGGFTDVLLQHGAARVVGVDVGHGQLHRQLKEHANVLALEGVNARELTPAALGDAMPGEGFDLLVADLSFISLAKVVHAWPALLKPGGVALSLVKPQFEVGRAGVGRGGLVSGDEWYEKVERDVRSALAAASLDVLDYFGSSIRGGDGNREFFVWARRR